MVDMPLLARALDVAARAHHGQHRKGGRVPYVTHPLRVMARVRAWGVEDEETLAAAALHDVVEDTDVTPADLEADFGPRVARLVDRLTHAQGLKPDERTRVILESLADAPLEALVIKLADRLDNASEMVGWRASSRRGYLGEAEEFARLARDRLDAGDGHPSMRAVLQRALDEYEPAIADKMREAERDVEEARRPRGR